MLIPVVLSGGKGTRLWPVSREAHPKPFMRLFGEQSLLQSTLLRSGNLPDVGEIMLVTNRDYFYVSEDELKGIQERLPCKSVRYLLEPVGRNTAPAIGIAALAAIADHGRDAVMIVMPSDHVVADERAFARAAAAAVEAAKSGALVTFGVEPKYPETGYGYIEFDPAIDAVVRPVKRFVEKPDIDTARDYVASGNYFWNAGIFCFTAGAIWDSLQQHNPELAAELEKAWRFSKVEANGRCEIDAATFGQAEDISIDYAVMEKADNVMVVGGDFGWSDVGSWESISGVLEQDAQGNSIVGDAVLVETTNTHIQSENRLIATVGVDNLIIVDTPDALLVGRRDRSQLVKKVVKDLQDRDHESHRLHRTVHRPWGTYTVIEDSDQYKIKRLEVKPGASLSLQLHHHRSEHWVVVDGVATVTNGDNVFDLGHDQSTYIPAGNKHRLQNRTESPVVIIETQTGSYLGEDDIVRFEDNYGRAESE